MITDTPEVKALTLPEKREYIHGRLSSWSTVHNDLHEYIMVTDIPRTQNTNGMFINLMALKEPDIQSIYDRCLACESYTEITEITLTQEIPSPPKPKPIIQKIQLKKIPLTKTQKTLLALM